MELQLVKPEDMGKDDELCNCEDKGVEGCGCKPNAGTGGSGVAEEILDAAAEISEMVNCSRDIIKNLLEECGYRGFDCESIPETVEDRECEITHFVKDGSVIEVRSGEKGETGERFLAMTVLLEEDAHGVIEQLKDIYGDEAIDD